MAKVFERDLAYSENRNAAYVKILRCFYPDGQQFNVITDHERQRRGHDIEFNQGGKRVIVQVKERRKDYGDFCIEYRHDYIDGFREVGWIEKYRHNGPDYILYIAPNLAWLIDYRTLLAAWLENREDWIGKYDLSPSDNGGYLTRNIAVPFRVLAAAGVRFRVMILEDDFCG